MHDIWNPWHGCVKCSEGWENIMLSVTCKNQRRADERIPILLSLPFKHKGIMCAPFIGPFSIEKYLGTGQIEQVICGGENYDGARPCDFDWVKSLRSECVAYNITFCFIETGSVFIKDGKRYHLPKKQVQSEMAYKSGMSYVGKPSREKPRAVFRNDSASIHCVSALHMDSMPPLTAKEFDIFALLILNPRRVFTYEMIADIVWNEPYNAYSRKTIINHISNIRRKLKLYPEIPDYIKSVYGIGYKFDIPNTKE